MYFNNPSDPYKQNGNSGTKHMLTFLAALAASDAKKPDSQPGTLIRA